MNELPRVTPDISASDLADNLDEFGGVIIENILSSKTIETINTEISPYIAATPTGHDEFEGKCTTRTGGFAARSAAVRKLIANPLVLNTVEEIFGNDTTFQFDHGQLIAIGPGESGQPMHRDQWNYGFYPFSEGYETIVQTMWALTPFTEINGGTRYVPGSHKDPELTQIVRKGRRTRLDYSMNSAPETIRYHYEDSVPVEMQAGSMLMWSGKLYHGGGANNSDQTRWGLNIGYSRGWIRQEENQYLTIPAEVLEEIDDDLARLLGWARSGYGHGYVGDMRDPLDCARGREGHQGFGDPSLAPNKLGGV
jgi:ectoine hydroxylase-related dioxygenase (phytanoyl-CoA dioxygenase family)